MKKFLGLTVDGISAGVMISIGGTVFLSCADKVVGSVFFAVALLAICFKGYSLFTGKVGYLPEKHGKEEFTVLLTGLLGNAIATVLLGFLLRATIPAIGETANAVCTAKLTQEWWQTLVRGAFCGVLMYIAVSVYRDNKTPLGILFCIPVFILCGFEHSIADMFYFGASGIFSFEAFLFLMLVVLGNAIGAILMSMAHLFAKTIKG
ncbi:MAG: formate/nitrite transporter family protein [Clostridia bacterium]|nr:formate/nitrite transporter family protein [Clostridia bacterium]